MLPRRVLAEGNSFLALDGNLPYKKKVTGSFIANGDPSLLKWLEGDQEAVVFNRVTLL